MREFHGNKNLGENDRLTFGVGITAADVGVSREANDLILTLTGSGDSIRIEGQFNFSSWFSDNDIETFQFADGTAWTHTDVAAMLAAGTSGADHILGTFREDTIDGKAGDDLLEGGDGSDTYLFGRGYGQDEIRESLSNANLAENDQLRFMPGVTLADLRFERAGNDLIVVIVDTGDSVRITGQYNYSAWYTWNDLERFTFDDGTFLTKKQVQQIILTPTSNDDHLIGSGDDDTLDGGAGNDTLAGSDGSDTYYFDRGSGNDVIRESANNTNLSEFDTLTFRDGISPAAVVVTREGQDAVFTLDTGETIRVVDQFVEGYNETLTGNDIERVTFADGTIWDKREIAQQSLRGTAGSDTLIGSKYAEDLTGGAGQDRLEGRGGSDRYIYALGDGDDTIVDATDGNGINRIVLGPDITASQLRFSNNPADPREMRISFASAAGSIHVLGQWSNNSIQAIDFADGTIWNLSEITAAFVAGQASTGSDTIFGTPGDNVFSFGRGDGIDTIIDLGHLYYWGRDSGGLDRLELRSGIGPNDVKVVQTSAQDIAIKIVGTNDRLVLSGQTSDSTRRIEAVTFADGTSWTHLDLLARALTPTSGADTFYAGDTPSNLIGGAGNDILNGSHGNDTLDGGTGDDLLVGNSGDDLYRFGRGDGVDRIQDRGSSHYWGDASGGTDTIALRAGITPGDLVVTSERNVNDLRLTIAGTTDSIIIENAMSNPAWQIENFLFADGTVWSHSDLVAHSFGASAGPDTINGDDTSNTIDGLGGNDTINAGGGNDTLVGGTGDDLLIGASGDDIYRFARGHGRDVIREFSGSGGGIDTIELAADITPADVSFSQADSGYSLVLSINGTTDSIRMESTVNNVDYRVEQVRFADGTVLSYADMLARSMVANDGDDSFAGGYDADTLIGGAGNDILDARSGNDTLIGGPGNDVLTGAGNDDVYVFNRGDGEDIIREDPSGWFSGTDVIAFGAGIAAADIVVRQERNGNDLRLTIAGTTDSILIENTMVHAAYRVESVRFADGTVLSHADLAAKAALDKTIFGSDMADTLVGTNGDDVFDGQKGNDLIQSGAGNDTHIFRAGDGNDIIEENSGSLTEVDTLRLLGISSTDVTFSRAGTNSLMKVNATGETITLRWQFYDANYWGVEQIAFADGVTWDRARIEQESWVRGTAAADSLSGSAGADTFVGGSGDDRFYSGAGSDTYIYASGDGDDWIDEESGSRTELDTLRFLDLNPMDVTFSREGAHGKVRVNATGHVITFDEQFYNADHWGLDQIAFADGTLWDRARIQQESWIRGTGAADSLSGTAGADTFVGGLGDDRFYSNAGSDTYIYASGDGNDWIDEESGSRTETDTLRFLDLNPSDVTFLRQGVHGKVRVNATGHVITFDEQYYNADHWGLDQIAFADGTLWDRARIEQETWMEGTDGADNLIGTPNADNIAGGGGDDTISGADGADRLSGGAGNDLLTGGGGNDALDGGLGLDVAVYAGLQASYSIVTGAGSIQIVDNQPIMDGNDGTDILRGVEQAEFKGGVQVALAAPIILDLDGDGVELVDRSRSKAKFDWDGDGRRDKTGWVGKGDGILVYDRDGNGTVSGANEISFLDDKPGAKSDLDGLSAFDANGDGAFSDQDAAWAEFRIWKDADRDGKVDKGELISLAQAGVASISLTGTATERSWGMGENIIVNNGHFTRTDGSVAALGDVALNYAASSKARSGLLSKVSAFFGKDRGTPSMLPAASAILSLTDQNTPRELTSAIEEFSVQLSPVLQVAEVLAPKVGEEGRLNARIRTSSDRRPTTGNAAFSEDSYSEPRSDAWRWTRQIDLPTSHNLEFERDYLSPADGVQYSGWADLEPMLSGTEATIAPLSKVSAQQMIEASAAFISDKGAFESQCVEHEQPRMHVLSWGGHYRV